MEQHPIPQNVTSFEFHLVGDMTLKQFLYLGTGIGTAYLLYSTIFYSFPVIALPLIILSVLFGVSFAFLPILDRPLDHWIKAFFKAVYSPTTGFLQTKNGIKQKVAPDDPFLKSRLQLYLSSMGMNVNTWDNLPSSLTSPKIALPQIPPKKAEEIKQQPELPTNKELVDLVEMAKQAQVLQAKITDTENLIKQMTFTAKPADLSQVSANLQHLITQTEELYHKTSQMNQVATPLPEPKPLPQIKPQPIPTPQPVVNPKVVIVETTPHKETLITLTSSPNVINGIVSDNTGNCLVNVIVIIHNKEGLPVRALKTNKLGQFVGSTPLPSGVYTITLEKEGFIFQTLQVTLENSVMAPIRIASQKGGS